MSTLLPAPKHKNPRGIPQAPFITAVTDYAKNIDEATQLLGELQERTQKYKFMEVTIQSRLRNLRDTVPPMKETLETVKFLQNQHSPFETQYNLNDTVYAKAEIQPTQTCFLWLGAGVMLEYPLEEAQEVMHTKVEAAESAVKACEEDLEFLTENKTVMEVNIARVINWQVAERKKTEQKK